MVLSRSFVSRLLFASILILITGCTLPAAAQENQQAQPSVTVGGVEIKGLPDDWTHHHLVFSNPGMEQDALANGTYGRWLGVVNDPRYVIQQLKRHAPALGPAAEDVARIEASHAQHTDARENELVSPLLSIGGGGGGGGGGGNCRGHHCSQIHKDWNVGLDGAAATATGTVGTLNSTNISGSSTLTIGGVTFDASPPTPESSTLTVNSLPTSTGDTVTVTNGSHNFVLTENATAASTTATFNALVTASPLTTTMTVGPDSYTLSTTASASAYSLTLDSGGSETTTGSITYSYTGVGGSTYTFTISPSSSTTGCALLSGTAYTGTFQRSTSGSTAASRFRTALSDCVAAASLSSHFTVGGSSSTATLTDNYLGAFLTVTSNTLNHVSGTPTAGSNGTTQSCGSSSPYTVNFDVTNSASGLANNLYTTLGLCTNTHISLSYTSGSSSLMIAPTVLGTDTYTSANNTQFSFSPTSGGSNGTNTCSSSSAGTFGTSTTTALVASAISAAINACSSAIQAATGINNVSTVTGSGVNVFAYIPGTTGGSGLTLSSGGGFASGGGSFSGGTDGTTSGTSTPPTFAYWSGNTYVSSSQVATNIATAINANTTLQAVGGVMANSSSNVDTLTARANGTAGNSIVFSAASFLALTLSGSGHLAGGGAGTGKVQPNAYPAKYGVSLTGASCSDFVIYPTGQAGATGTASVIAYYNLYTTGCAGAVPSVYWSYNTGGTVTTSPVLSYDGSQVAFIQVSGTTASLVLLKWAPGPPMTLTNQGSGSAYQSCTAPCMYTLALGSGANDTFSAPFYDYSHDILYVGDDSGKLHQFTGVFNGAPAQSGNPWPVTLGASKLSSPVYDCDCGFEGGYVFVGDFGGVFYSVGTGYGGTTNAQVNGNTGSIGDAIADAPLVDSSEGTEFVFVTTDGTGQPYAGDNAVWEFVSIFTNTTGAGVAYLGTGGAGYYLYAGDFDNVYYDSGNPAAGHLYVVGNTGTLGGGTLYQVGIAYSSLTGNVTAVATGLNSTVHPWPSPLTEFCNNGADPCSLSQRTATGSLSITSPNVTLTSGNFTGADLGAQIWASPSNILYGKVITSILSSTTADLEFGVTANETGQTFTIQDAVTTSGTDYVFFSVNRGTGSGCTNTAGNGCILSYNVTSTFHAATGTTHLNSQSVTGTSGISSADVHGTIAGPGIPAGDTITAYSGGTATLAIAATANQSNAPLTITPLLTQTGTGLNVTTPSTNGCWATGGFVIDNSDNLTTGAQQIYFVNLNGASAGGASGNTSSACTTGTANLNATQASQSNP